MITKANWRKYIDRLSEIDKRAGDLMQAWINEHGLENGEAAIQYAYALVTKYGEASATLACEMYDHMAQIMEADVPEAVPAETATMKEVAKGVTWGKYHSPSQIPSIVSRQTRQAGADTMIQNAKRDKAQWAWVPQGDTCAFCMTLASRGWQDASRTVLKGYHAEHIHQNCDCTFAIAFKEKDKRQYDYIYDPDKYLDMYNEAGGDINEMRRQIYAKKRDTINAQKIDADQVEKFDAVKTKHSKIYSKSPLTKEDVYDTKRHYESINESIYEFSSPRRDFYNDKKDEILAAGFAKVTPKQGYTDFAIHGDPENVDYTSKIGQKTEFTATEFADIIRLNKAYNGGPIRLFGCKTGQNNDGFAYQLAISLGTEVMAPTEDIWIDSEGNFFISNNEVLASLWYEGVDVQQTGHWRVFPEGRIV